MARSEGQSTEMDRLAQHELMRLERKFRAMQDDRPAIPDSTRKILSKQEHLIKILEKEIDDLKITLSLAEAPISLKAKESCMQKVNKIFTEYMETVKLIEEENTYVQELEEKVRELDAAISDLHFTEDVPQDSVAAIKKRGKILDNLRTLLHVETVKFNQVSLENKDLRKEIDHLLQERGRFNKIFQILGKKLKMGKQILLDLIEQSTIAYDERHEAQAKLDALKVQAKHDLLVHCMDMKQLMRKVDLRTQLNQFVSIKGQKRIAEESEFEKIEREDEEKLQMIKYVENYREVVGNLMEGFGEANIDKLVARFLKYDEDNYNIFSFINDLNKKLDGLREEICDIEVKITNQRKTSEDLKKKRKAVIAKLEAEYNAARKKLEDTRNAHNASVKALEGLLKATLEFARSIAVNADSIVKKLGRNNAITRFNIDEYMKLIEKRVIDIYLIGSYFAYRPSRKSTMRVRPLVREVIPETTRIGIQPCPLCAELIDISDVDENVVFPMDNSELAASLQDTIHRGLYDDIVHPVDDCRLPKSRRIIQKRMN